MYNLEERISRFEFFTQQTRSKHQEQSKSQACSSWSVKSENSTPNVSRFVKLTSALQTKIADLVQITPENFGRASHLAIEDSINAKYSNKVIQKIGLCICMYDLLWASEGLIGHGDGVVNVNGNYLPSFSVFFFV